MGKLLYETLKIRLHTEDKCFGPGIAELLERVQEQHSLRAAAQSMGMSYSKAWTRMRNCEAALERKLLSYTVGGKNGGGAELTEDAKELLAAYRGYCEVLQRQADELFPEYFGAFMND